MTQPVIAAVDDLLFAAKIRGTAEQVGVTVQFARTVEAVIDVARRDGPSLIIVDLHSQKIDPILLAQKLKADEQLRSVALLGFFSHVETELQRRAKEAGYDHVLPRSAFAKNLPEILRSP